MSQQQVSTSRTPKTGLGILAAVIIIAGIVFAYIWSLSPAGQEKVLYLAQDYLPILMFVTLASLLFSGYPVAFILGGLALIFGFLGYLLGITKRNTIFHFVRPYQY